jgi:hypothetical protein
MIKIITNKNNSGFDFQHLSKTSFFNSSWSEAELKFINNYVIIPITNFCLIF